LLRSGHVLLLRSGHALALFSLCSIAQSPDLLYIITLYYYST
jgi:hypothetical protein